GLMLQDGDNYLQGNLIGMQADGVSPLGNGLNGIDIEMSWGSSNNTVGGSPAGSNRIAFNRGSGIFIEGDSSTGNAFLSNSIFANNALGIDLKGAAGVVGVTPNDPGDLDHGGNNLQNYPVLDSAVAGSSSITIQGSLGSSASATFTLEFFSN